MSLPLGRCGPGPGRVAWLVECGLDISLLPLPAALEQCMASSAAALGRWPPSCCLTLTCSHRLPLLPPPGPGSPGQEGQRVPLPAWPQEAPGSKCLALCPGRDAAGRFLAVAFSAPIISPLGWLESRVCLLSGSLRAGLPLLSLTCPPSALSWAWLMLRGVACPQARPGPLVGGQGGFLE